MTATDRAGDAEVGPVMDTEHSLVGSIAESSDDRPEDGDHRSDRERLADATDGELLELLRAGRDAAFAELFSRHAAAVRGYAMRCTPDVVEAEDIAAEAFFRVLQAVRRGSGPDGNVRGYLLTVVRRLAAEWSIRRRDVPVADEELSRRADPDADQSASRADQHLIARAFSSLPQRWRSVLWRVEVEGERPAVVAEQFGLSANATAALARRAREGLRAAYLQAHVAPASGPDGCRVVVGRLGAYTAGQVRGAESGRIRSHLAGCRSCRSLHAELADVCAGLRRYAGLLPAPVLGGHQLMAAKAATAKAAVVAKVATKVATVGMRLKLSVVAASVALVGGFGVALGPVLSYFLPSVHADGQGVDRSQLTLISSGSGGPSGPTGSSASGARSSSTDRATTTRDQARPPATDPAPAQPANLGAASPVGQTGLPLPTEDVSPATRTLQLQDTPAVRQTTDPVTLTTARAPVTADHRPATPTVWSTVWTTNGTTVWMTVWSLPPGRGN